MAAAAVAFSVVIAPDTGVIGQLVCQEICHLVIGIAGDTAVEPDSGLGQGSLGTAADTATDQHLRLELLQ